MYGIFPYIYHKKSTIHVGKYASPMDGMGWGPRFFGATAYEAFFATTLPENLSVSTGYAREVMAQTTVMISGFRRKEPQDVVFKQMKHGCFPKIVG